MQIKTAMTYHPHLLELLLSTIQVMTSVGEVVGKKKPLFTASGNVNWYNHYGKQYGGSSKIKTRVTILLSSLSSRYLPKNLKTFICKDICTLMFIVPLFAGARTWKQLTRPSIDAWTKMWYIYTMECYTAIRKDEVLPLVTA